MHRANIKSATDLCKRPLALGILLYLSTASAQTMAQMIEAKLHNGITVTANYHAGVPSQPAVVLLHGFLQTQNSPPMSTLAGNLASKGYTTLNPTLSLGINTRKQSMPCEAMHTHTIESNVAEIAYWVDWLYKNGNHNIALVGFSSTGNFEILLYNAKGSHPAIKKIILTSLSPIDSNPAEQQKTRAHSETRQNTGPTHPETYSLGYCKNNFVATRKTYLSYAQFNENKILELVRLSPLPPNIILGSADNILPKNWAARISALKSSTRVRIIENANHFFDGTAEFDLAEAVEGILKNMQVQ